MSGHTCTPPGDSAEDILGVAYDLRCSGCVDMLVHMHGPMLPVAAFDARSAVERETIARVVALVHREIRERDALGHIDAVQAFCSLCEQLKNGEWKGEP